MPGGPTDAEDVVQEHRLRWADTDRSDVHDPGPYVSDRTGCGPARVDSLAS